MKGQGGPPRKEVEPGDWSWESLVERGQPCIRKRDEGGVGRRRIAGSVTVGKGETRKRESTASAKREPNELGDVMTMVAKAAA